MTAFKVEGLGAVKPPPRSADMRVMPGNLDTQLKATWWAQREGGNWYWRCTIPSRHLPGQVLSLRYDDLREYDGHIVMPRHRGGAAVWSYAGNATRGILMRAQQQAGLRVLMEVDDNYLISSPPVPKGGTDWQFKLDKVSGSDRHSHEAHEKLARFADGIIVTTETLAAAYRKVNEHVYVCRNSVDLDDWEEPEKPNDGIFRVGYAASHSHWFDANDVQRALHWAAEQPGVQVVMLGLNPGWSFNYTHVPWTKDLAGYRKSLQVIDLGLCPLREGPWADSKSDIKLMEYAMSGAASVVADRPPYQDWVDSPEALTARTPKDFLKQVKWAVANQDGVREIAQAAKERILRERTIQHEIHKWAEAVACP